MDWQYITEYRSHVDDRTCMASCGAYSLASETFVLQLLHLLRKVGEFLGRISGYTGLQHQPYGACFLIKRQHFFRINVL